MEWGFRVRLFNDESFFKMWRQRLTNKQYLADDVKKIKVIFSSTKTILLGSCGRLSG